MKYLIVNADDFGASRGINRGIIEAHRNGIVTSASLMVNAPFAEEAAQLAHKVWHLSVGLHAELPADSSHNGSGEDVREALERQFARFRELMRRSPTHLDSHHNAHRDPLVQPLFIAFAARHNLPLRDHSPVRCFTAFYGRWNGESHPEQISTSNLVQMLETEIGAGVTELTCHPGYADAGLVSTYCAEREIELRTLCDPAIQIALRARAIALIGYHDLGPSTTRLAA
jgi:predicted glycoside hydrolase/deacetylase ChbG (UPF0249 family)